MNKTIYLAGGCFWGVEAFFESIKGILNTKVGYANGKIQDPTYEKVCSGETGFAEVVFLEYDNKIINLNKILEALFEIIDPTSLNRQGFDSGSQYRSGVFYVDEEDKVVIENFIKKIQQNYNKPIVTEVKKLENFYPAESYHQKYLQKNPNGYCHINLTKANKYK